MQPESPAVAAARQKALGAFYTPPEMAQKLVRWALRSPQDCVLDPSFGGLVFLDAASERLRALGASRHAIQTQIFGGELDDAAHAAACADRRFRSGPDRLRHGDFLSMEAGQDLPIVDAVVGNPPYVRYQGFNSEGTRGHDLAARAGVRLTRLASSWAPFVVHAASFVRDGGRMAQVLPAEILHAQYADAVLAFLRRSFASVTLVMFERRVFPGALEEVVLLLADGRAVAPATQVRVVDCVDLDGFNPNRLTSTLDAEQGFVESRESLLAQLLPMEVRRLYAELAESAEVKKLGEIASVDIGAVTGANAFFLVKGDDSRVPERFLRPAVSKAAHVRGARLTEGDLRRLGAEGKPMLLLAVPPEHPREDIVDLKEYLEFGVQEEIDRRYKCRKRDPWWTVPLPKHGIPDALLTYCSSDFPRLVCNEAGVLHTNTVHGVTMRDAADPAALAAGFPNSLTLLSAELAGRSYGGGVLKLEPTEAEALLVPKASEALAERLGQIDSLLRVQNHSRVLNIVDALSLGDRGLGLSGAEVRLLRDAAGQLRARRRMRGKAPSDERATAVRPAVRSRATALGRACDP